MKKHLHYMSFISVGVFAIVSILYSLQFFVAPENFLRDIFISPKPVNQNIVILEIDNDAIQKYGQWPWPRSVFAEIFSKLDQAHPSIVGFDVLLADRSRYGVEDDTSLQNVLAKINFPVVMPTEAQGVTSYQKDFFSKMFVDTQHEFLARPTISLGHINLILDRDGVVRRVPFVLNPQPQATLGGFASTTNALAFEVASFIHPGIIVSNVEKIVYSAYPGSIRHVSISRFMNDSIDELFKNKVVLIGATSPDLHDEKPTPFSRGTQMAGVEIQANIINQLLMGYRSTELSTPWAYGLFFMLTSLPLLFFIFLKRIYAPFIGIGIVFVILGVVILVSEQLGFYIPIIYSFASALLSALALFLYRYYIGDRDKHEMKKLFSKYVSRDVLQELLRDPSKVQLGGEERLVSVFFSDVRGFTALSEQLSPSELVALLNRYMTRMSDIILEKNGVIDKYIGDAIMAFWGAPLINSSATLDAISAGLLQIDALEQFNKENREAGDVEIHIGIGISTGLAVVGNMGSHERFDYTVMGDTVNLASRLEGQTKTYGVHIIVSEYTIADVTPEVLKQNNILFREIDKVMVKGKKQPIRIFEIVENSNISFVRDINEIFNEARNAYYEGDWATCREKCKEIMLKGTDGPTAVLLARSEAYIDKPPAVWQGVYELLSK